MTTPRVTDIVKHTDRTADVHGITATPEGTTLATILRASPLVDTVRRGSYRRHIVTVTVMKGLDVALVREARPGRQQQVG